MSIYGNVFQYDTDQLVYGNVHEWVALTTPPVSGWNAGTLCRIWLNPKPCRCN